MGNLAGSTTEPSPLQGWVLYGILLGAHTVLAMAIAAPLGVMRAVPAHKLLLEKGDENYYGAVGLGVLTLAIAFHGIKIVREKNRSIIETRKNGKEQDNEENEPVNTEKTLLAPPYTQQDTMEDVKVRAAVGELWLFVRVLPMAFFFYFGSVAIWPSTDDDEGLGRFSLQIFYAFTWMLSSFFPVFISRGNRQLKYGICILTCAYLIIFDSVIFSYGGHTFARSFAIAVAVLLHAVVVKKESAWLRGPESQGFRRLLPTVKELISLSLVIRSISGLWNYMNNKETQHIAFLMQLLLAFTVMVSQFYQYDYHSGIQKETKDIERTLTVMVSKKKPYTSLRTDCENAFSVAAPACVGK